jgi:adenylate cyclase
MSQALEQKGMYAEALAELTRAQRIQDWYWLTVEFGCVNALTGKGDEAQKIIAELSARSPREYIDETEIAYICTALGDYDQAFAWLEKAYQSHASGLPWIIMEPKFDPIRSDPHFDELVRRMGLK